MEETGRNDARYDSIRRQSYIYDGWIAGSSQHPATRGHFCTPHSTTKKPLPAAAPLLTFRFGRIEHGKGDLLDKRFMNPSAIPVCCYLFYRRVYTRRFTKKMRGWYVHANHPQREIFKNQATLESNRSFSDFPAFLPPPIVRQCCC